MKIIVLVASLRDAISTSTCFHHTVLPLVIATTLRGYAACMVLIAPGGASHAFGMEY